MTRVLVIDRDRSSAPSMAMACLDSGVAVRMAETLCEGVRCLLGEPVSVVLVDSGLMRLSGMDVARLFDAVAPDVPVVVLVGPELPAEEVVSLQVRGFHVVPKPFDVIDVVAKLDFSRRSRPPRAWAASHVAAACR